MAQVKYVAVETDALRSAVKDALAGEGVAEIVVDVILDHAAESLPLDVVRRAIESNGWSASKVGAEISLSDIDLGELAYEVGGQDLLDAAASHFGEAECLEHLMGNIDYGTIVRAVFDVAGVNNVLGWLTENAKNEKQNIKPEVLAAFAEAYGLTAGVTTPAAPVKTQAELEAGIKAKVNEGIKKILADVASLVSGTTEGV